jgi:hypothetical protein
MVSNDIHMGVASDLKMIVNSLVRGTLIIQVCLNRDIYDISLLFVSWILRRHKKARGERATGGLGVGPQEEAILRPNGSNPNTNYTGRYIGLGSSLGE